MNEIKDDKYSIIYDPTQAIITCEGELLLNGAPAYEPVLKLLTRAALEQQAKSLSIDIRGLKFLNSSGINMLTKFIMGVCDNNTSSLNLTFVAWKHIAWQEKLTANLTRLMPSLQTRLEKN
jgi:hypothetical protein